MMLGFYTEGGGGLSESSMRVVVMAGCDCAIQSTMDQKGQ